MLRGAVVLDNPLKNHVRWCVRQSARRLPYPIEKQQFTRARGGPPHTPPCAHTHAREARCERAPPDGVSRRSSGEGLRRNPKEEAMRRGSLIKYLARRRREGCSRKVLR
jgi:hypothetical protein